MKEHLIHPSFSLKALLLSILLIFALSSITQASSTLSYQGRLTNNTGEPVPDSTYIVTFLLFPDSVIGNILWAETGTVNTSNGLFSHILGEIEPLNTDLFITNAVLYLEIRIDNIPLVPRTPLTATGYSITTGSLNMRNQSGDPAIVTDPNSSSLTIYDSLGVAIKLQPYDGDSSVVLPNDAVNSDEMLNEPGVTTTINTNIIPLMTGEMQDLLKITIEIPEDGYIVLQGKCYLLLSGTTGTNTAIVQIDQNEGGGTNFPYYAIAGLSGYVNTGTNYFPVFVTRTYYRTKGTHTFRMEGRASNPPPAEVESWDHVLVATYYPTSYYGVEAVISNIDDIPLRLVTPIERTDSSGTQYYKVDWHEVKLLESKK